jgi:hypothetical protein
MFRRFCFFWPWFGGGNCNYGWFIVGTLVLVFVVFVVEVFSQWNIPSQL